MLTPVTASVLTVAALFVLAQWCDPIRARRSHLARMGAKLHLRSKISQGLLMYLLVASAAAASLDADIQAGKTYIKLQPGTHTFSGANVSDSLTIVGASAGDTTVECSGAFAVMGALALHNLSITGCRNCHFDAAIQAPTLVTCLGKCECARWRCGSMRYLLLAKFTRRVNLTDNTAH